MTVNYPSARRTDLVETLHDVTVADPYRWLEDARSTESQEWLHAQDDLYAEHARSFAGRERLLRRIRQLTATGAVSAPVVRGGRHFFLRRGPDQQHAVLHTEVPGVEPARVLLDPVRLDPSGRTTLDAWQPDKEGRQVAYQISSGGDEASRLYVLDVATGEILVGPIDRCRYSAVAWLPGGKSFYYVRGLPPGGASEGGHRYHRRVYLHRLGTDPADDVLIFGDGLDHTNHYRPTVSRDGRWLLLSCRRGTAPRADLLLADLLANPPEAPVLVPVQVGEDVDTRARVGNDGLLYLLTNRAAPNRRLCVADPRNPGPAGWRDVLPEDSEAVLQSYQILDGAELPRPLVLAVRTRHGISEISVHDLRTGERLHDLRLPELGTVDALCTDPEPGHDAWYAFQGFATPPAVFHLDGRSLTSTLWAAAPGQVDLPPVHSTVVHCTSADGTPIRALAVLPTGPARPRPCILSGYGGFGQSLTPTYSASLLAWVEAGGGYVVAQLRGGGEEGERWHRAGRREHKHHTFEDFHAVAERLVGVGITTPAQLAAHGNSNGGLLVGAALTQRPELYAAVVCSTPLLDMVRYERTGLGRLWVDEYGSADVAEEFHWLHAYSPYHRVAEGTAYPATLFMVFDSDTRVSPMHARKMCAALQHATTADRPVLLRREADAGHGARSVSRAAAMTADYLAFLATHTGLIPEQPR